MFFTGDSSTRKRVDLGGRSTKERDRQKVLEEARLERKRRLGLRQQNNAAVKIQKCFRGRKAVESERSKIREQFCINFGEHCQKVDRHCFNPDSAFLRQLLFFFDPCKNKDFIILVETCRLFHQYIEANGNIISLFAGMDFSSNRAIVEHRVKQITFACLGAIHQNRDGLKDELLMSRNSFGIPTVILLEAVASLLDNTLPWACKNLGFLSQRNAFGMLRDIVLTGVQSIKPGNPCGSLSSLERVLIIVSSHIAQQQCDCLNIDPRWSFPLQILSIPFIWKHFPHLKEVFATQGLSKRYVNQMTSFSPGHSNILPDDISHEFPGYACLVGNLLEAAVFAVLQPSCMSETAMGFAVVSTFWMQALPPIKLSILESQNISTQGDEDMESSEESTEVLNVDLQGQILKAIDPHFLKSLVNVLFEDVRHLDSSCRDGQTKAEVAAFGAVCAFLHVTFSILPLERIITGLAYTTELVPKLWNFMKWCHENQRWPSLSELTASSSGDAPGWLLPLSVFCPVYRHMLMIIDNEEFYEKEKPLSLQDVRSLIIFLKEVLWMLLWVIPAKSPTFQKLATNPSDQKKLSIHFIQHRVSIVTSELLAQLQDWNNRRQFISPNDFHASEAADESFFSQAMNENSRGNTILKQAPFLVPFTSRVRIYTSQLAAARQRNGSHAAFTRHRFRIRRDHMVEDAYSQLSTLSEEDLRGMIRVTFVNEFGVEEAGIDGGGIFKDFMENITRAAFDVQYGLFKETSDHLLYPNPASGMIHEQHLQYFRFLGIVVGKAMFEGILVDIPFATFFLSKLKQKYNYLNDLPSLDPELYRHLLFLKHYKGDISELELYFVIVNNEYGEQTEDELLPGGKDIRVTNENVIMFIHLVANHRLNFQIRQQSSYFLRGLQQLIQQDWIAMLNEHELQLLISGSPEGLDVNDLRSSSHYAGGYHENHPAIDMFWEVIKNFSLEHQKKFLKTFPEDASEDYLDRLPTSATCMNLLKLPPYQSKEKMQKKLIYAIDAEAGFDLS